MKNIFKKVILNIIFFALTLVLPLSFVNAQAASQRWVCLKAEQTDAYTGHSATISVDPKAKLLPDSDTYIFECLSSSQCTSGDSALDQEIFGKDNLTELADEYGYSFAGSELSSNPLMSDSNGEVAPFLWASYSTGHARRWLAMNYYQPATTATANEGGQQLGTFDFDSVFNQSDCVSISWDPYGRVFDNKTLEPVNQATVALYVKDGSSYRLMTPADILGGNIINPQVTKEDGNFSFVVPDGTYKLMASKSNYSFPEEIGNLQANYSKIYSDIYPAQTGVDIVQKGAIQHRDIPLKQNSLVVSDTPAKLMEYFYDLDKLNSVIIVKGRVSHPFAEIRAYSLKDGARFRLLTETPIKADKTGNFTLKIDQSKFDVTETFGDIVIEKTDLTLVNLAKSFFESLINKIIGKVNAQTLLASSVRFEPILNYIEGYAYDSAGNILPNTTVSVYLEFSNKPYYQTTTDSRGFYKISSEFLPSMPYHLSYTTTNGQITPTANSKFIVQNEKIITESDIKINQFKDSQGEVVTPTTTPKNNTNPTESNGNKLIVNNKLNPNFVNKNYSQMIVLGFVILFLIVLVCLVLVYLKKKQSQNSF